MNKGKAKIQERVKGIYPPCTVCGSTRHKVESVKRECNYCDTPNCKLPCHEPVKSTGLREKIDKLFTKHLPFIFKVGYEGEYEPMIDDICTLLASELAKQKEELKRKIGKKMLSGHLSEEGISYNDAIQDASDILE
jgi:hypothetical protein